MLRFFRLFNEPSIFQKSLFVYVSTLFLILEKAAGLPTLLLLQIEARRFLMIIVTFNLIVFKSLIFFTFCAVLRHVSPKLSIIIPGIVMIIISDAYVQSKNVL